MNSLRAKVAPVSCKHPQSKQLSRCYINFPPEPICQILTNQSIKIDVQGDHGKKRSSPPVFLKNWLNFRDQFEIKILIVRGHSDINQNILYESLEKINLSPRSFETGNLSADNVKNAVPRWVDTWDAVWSGDTGQRIPCFESCQLITNWCAVSFLLGSQTC